MLTPTESLLAGLLIQEQNSGLDPRLPAALRAQTARVRTLEAENAALKARVARLTRVLEARVRSRH